MLKNCFIHLVLMLWILPTAYAQWPIFEDVTRDKNILSVNTPTGVFGNGTSVVDIDNDGFPDVFVCTDFGQFNQLYRNLGNGQFEEIAQDLGISSIFRDRMALWFDYNNDQLLDLIIAGDCYQSSCETPIRLMLYQQQENGQFIDVTDVANINVNSKYSDTQDAVVGGMAVGDVNNDAYLDVLLTIWGGHMTLFINNADGSFSDSSESSGLGVVSKDRWQPLFHDFNEDGFQDIFINVDFAANEFWLNNGDNTFSDIATSIGADSDFNEMGVAIGDYDNDGDFDIYATNISREPDGTDGHNILLNNQWANSNELQFIEIANTYGVGTSGWDWGTTFLDVNNDGLLDLATTNGLSILPWTTDQSRLWLNLGDGLFGDISTSSEFNDTYNATSLVAFDLERDGDLDLLQSIKDNPGIDSGILIYENQLNSTDNPRNYIVIKPRMVDGANYFAIGTVVKITIDGSTQMRLITAGTSFYGQEPAEAYFGLNNATVIDELKIEWPNGAVTVMEDVEANQILTVTNDNVLSLKDDHILSTNIYPNPFNATLNIITNKSIEKILVFNLLGKQVFDKKLNDTAPSIDLSKLKSGFYLVQITYSDGTKSRTFKIMKN